MKNGDRVVFVTTDGVAHSADIRKVLVQKNPKSALDLFVHEETKEHMNVPHESNKKEGQPFWRAK